MGLEESRSKEFIKNVLDRYRILDKKSNDNDLTDTEKDEFDSLKKELFMLPESDPIKLLIEIENATSDLKKNIK